MRLWSTLRERLSFYTDYVVRCRGDKVAYLRRLGVRIGQDCSIYTTIGNFGTEPWLIEIGNKVTITSGVMLVTHDGASRLFRTILPDMNPIYGNRFGTIRIYDNCFLGVNAVILPEVTIGPNSIVGASSVVSRDVPPDTVVAGNPATAISTLDQYVERYKQKMLSVASHDREALRRELTRALWDNER